MKAWVTASKVWLKKPQTKFLPVRFGGFIYNMRRINEAAKKANKRGGAMITRIEMRKNGILVIDYRDHGSEGQYQLYPLTGFDPLLEIIPKATTTFEIEGVTV